jgi:hypothetical protein
MEDPGFVLNEECLCFRCIPGTTMFPALEFIESFDKRSLAHWRVVTRIMDIAEMRSMSMRGRVSVVQGRELRMLYVRVSRPGGRSPHVRLFAVRRGNTIWLATGFLKNTRAIPSAAIAAAETLILDWMARGEPLGL